MTPTLINVCGAARSGTTMLDLMLGNRPDAFACGEVYARFRPWQEHHFHPRCRCGRDPCPVWERIGAVPERRFHAHLAAVLAVEFISDSSKDLCWLVDTQEWALADGLRVYKILLWKRPVSLAYSHWKRTGDPHAWRGEFVGYYRRFFETGLPFRAVRFDDLVGDPPRTLAAICAAVGMPYRAGQERFWEKEHHYLFGSHGVYEQTISPHPAIRPVESYPPEFAAHIPALERHLAADEEVQRLLAVLRGADIFAGGFGPDSQRPGRRPYWYYLRRARQMAARYAPRRKGWVK